MDLKNVSTKQLVEELVSREAVEKITIFSKTVVPVNINEIAKQGGVLNCISWED